MMVDTCTLCVGIIRHVFGIIPVCNRDHRVRLIALDNKEVDHLVSNVYDIDFSFALRESFVA